MKVMKTEEIVDFLRPIAEAQGLELSEAEWDLRQRSLTLYVDREGGVDFVSLEAFHRAVDGPLDDLDPTFGAPYTLNCSSLGLDRPMKTERDFLRRMGEEIEVRLYAPFAGAKYYEGELVAFRENIITLKTAKGEIDIPFEKTSKVCLHIEV